MAEIKIDDKIAQQKQQLQEIGQELIEASKKFSLNKETIEILEDQIVNINDNFLFVIAGEVNAGKSSFVNALLGAPVCATSHEICTNEVQKITYGEEELVRDEPIDKVYVREFPAEILKDITIVDTPGTNSKELDHQVITERFIPHANLIVFVFMTENIHPESAWNLFRTIKDKWGKKVIFVMTKKDMYTPEQVESYKSTLNRYVVAEGIENPKIFTTSAIKEEQGHTEESGFKELRQYINNEVLHSAAEEKNKDDFKTLKSLFNQLSTDFDIRKEKYQKDQSTRDKIETIILTQEDNAKESIQNLVDRCLDVYDRNTEDFMRKLSSEIGFISLTLNSIRSIFGGEKMKDKMDRMSKELTTDLNRDMNAVIQNGTDNIKSDIQFMLTKVKSELDELKINELQPTQSFSQLEIQRNDIVNNLKYNLTNFIEKSEVFQGKNILDKQIDYSEANIASGVAAIGAVLTAIVSHSVFDVTGGIITSLAVLVTGGLAQFKKGKYLKDVRQTFEENREKLKSELEKHLVGYFNLIRDNVNTQFGDFDNALKTERIQIKNFDELSERVQSKFKIIEREL